MRMPIAIVGRGCVLPGATCPDAFLRSLRDARDLTGDAPEGRWRLGWSKALTDNPHDAADRTWSRRGGYVAEDVRPGGRVMLDRFGAVEIDRLDPLTRWLMHAGRGAFGEMKAATGTGGVVLGNLGFPSAGLSRFAEGVWSGAGGGEPLDRFMNALPGRLLAADLGLTGGAMALDAACASALYAIKIACDRLEAGDLDFALAGAVNCADDLFIHVGFSALNALSKTGQTRPFHAGADGLLPAEAAVVFALKRLDDAVRDGETIHGVIRGVGLSNDGRAGGILAPDSGGQVRAIHAALHASGLNPSDLGYVECHATGTPVGDSIELATLEQVFGPQSGVPIGSVKSNLGHPITAAGAVSLLKVLGSFASGEFFPTLHAGEHPVRAVQQYGLRVVTSSESWTGPRRAGVSAFGFGGNNAHLIVEAWEGQTLPAPTPPGTRGVVVLNVSTRLGALSDHEATMAWLATSTPAFTPRMDIVAQPIKGLRSPPNDLKVTLPQQVLMLALAREVWDDALDPSRTGVFVGMATDAEVARFGARWRLADWSDAGAQLLATQRDLVVPVLTAAGVVGTMPNIPANRISAQLDARGPGFVLCEDDASGLTALDTAMRAIARGEVDVAVVGASDFATEPVHRAACAALGITEAGADVGVALLLCAEDVALRLKRTPLAHLDRHEGTASWSLVRPDTMDAVGPLLDVALAAETVGRGVRPSGGGFVPWAGERTVHLHAEGQTWRLAQTGPANGVGSHVPVVLRFASDSAEGLRQDLQAAKTSEDGAYRAVVLANDPEQLKLRVQTLDSVLANGRTDYVAEGMVLGVRTERPLALITQAKGISAAAATELVLACPRVGTPDWPAAWSSGTTSVEGQAAATLALARWVCEIAGVTPAVVVGDGLGAPAAMLATGFYRDTAAWSADPKAVPTQRPYKVRDTQLLHPETLEPVPGVAARLREALGAHEAYAAPRVRAHLQGYDLLEIGGEGQDALSLNGQGLLADLTTLAAAWVRGHAVSWTEVMAAFARPHVAPGGPMLNLPAHWPDVTFPPSVKDALMNEPLHDSTQAMAAPPTLPPIMGAPATPTTWDGSALLEAPKAPVARPPQQGVRPTPSPAALPVPSVPTRRAPAPVPATVTPSLGTPVAQRVSDWAASTARAHAAFLERQADVHAQMMRYHQQAFATLASLAQTGGGAVMPAGVVPPPPMQPARQAVAAAPAVAQPVVTPPRSVAAVPSAPQPAAVAPTPPAPKPVAAPTPPRATPPAATKPAAAETSRSMVPASELPGLKLSKEQLKVHASGNISEIFGPMFAQQDGYERQCRMPEPPLLLADRVVGLDCEPGVLGKGTIWTETDVGKDGHEWYLHRGRMPAGVMIESGQADLMLISYMGIDFLNQSERVYRLLGCELTYHGNLPQKGETLRYDIHVDGHAKQGDVRLFFFHYDCVVDGEPRLTVRGGQAGFFTDEELADSAGILWTPETGEYNADARLDAPIVPSVPSSFTDEQLSLLASGDAYACMGPGYEKLSTHNDTPRIAEGNMRFLRRIVELDPTGGPWGRGYMKAEWPVSPDDWFFEGHFKNDPCMPGTLMFEGCLQALSFYLISMGYTMDRDGWRFEPVPGNPIPMRCRGQVRPHAKMLTYEVFIEEVHEGPIPMVFADLLCTVDGLGAFHARRCGLHLTPAWPLDHWEEKLLGDYVEPKSVAISSEGLPFDYRSLIACAWGRPSEAFGPIYKRFDGPTTVARLPGPPYHFMSRITEVDGPLGGMKLGTKVVVEYDLPPMSEWYYRENGHPVMPFAVLLEAALQPCGWLASYVGSTLTTENEIFFRNLDGTGTLHIELPPSGGIFKTEVEITQISQSGPMIIEGFDVKCTLDGVPAYTLKTVFGFFPGEALEDQKGISITDDDLANLAAPSDYLVDLTEAPERFCGGPARLADPMLRMVDRITGWWPEQGEGRMRGEKTVDVSEWFFKAHFFQDPVQPGSLGLEALLQLLQAAMLEMNLDADLESPRFEPLALDIPMTWKYRGQVVPKNKLIQSMIEITEIRHEQDAVLAIAEGQLWVDGLCIYTTSNMGMRLVSTHGPRKPPEETADDDDPDPAGESTATASTGRVFGHLAAAGETISCDLVRDPWMRDHCPTFTLASLPLMGMVDAMASVALGAAPFGQHLVEVDKVQVSGWTLVGEEPIELRVNLEPCGRDLTVATFERRDTSADRWRTGASAQIRWASSWPQADVVPRLTGLTDAPDPYASGTLFHGPSLQLMVRLETGPGCARGTLDLDRCGVPDGLLGTGLLDAATHVIPHDALHTWDDRIGSDQAAYPHQVEAFRLYGDLPKRGQVQVEAAYKELRGGRFPVTELLIRTMEGELLAEFHLVEILMPKGPLGTAAPGPRRQFLEHRIHVPGLGLGRADRSGKTIIKAADVHGSDWLPGTVATVYGANPNDLLRSVAARDHAARLLEVHPSQLVQDGNTLRALRQPFVSVRPVVHFIGSEVHVSGNVQPDWSPVRQHWREGFGLGTWPTEDLYLGLAETFLGRVVVEDPAALEVSSERPILLLANHQVALESLLFAIVAPALLGRPVVTIAKAQHRDTWLGRLIAHGFRWPGVDDPGVIEFFERTDPQSFGRMLTGLTPALVDRKKALMVHAQGTRARSCREPTQQVSSALIDLAVQLGADVIPVRFSGALPVEPVPEKLDLALGMARQDLTFGVPLSAHELAAMPYKERRDAVVQAIARTGPSVATETPNPPQHSLAARVQERAAGRGDADPVYSAMAEVLANRQNEHRGLDRLVRSGGRQRTGDAEEKAWLGLLAHWLYGVTP